MTTPNTSDNAKDSAKDKRADKDGDVKENNGTGHQKMEEIASSVSNVDCSATLLDEVRSSTQSSHKNIVSGQDNQVTAIVFNAAQGLLKSDRSESASVINDAAIVVRTDADMSGTLAFYAGNALHQAQVVNGLINDQDGKCIGSLTTNGIVTFNKEGQTKFGLNATNNILNITRTADAYFRSSNPAHKDIAGLADRENKK